MMTSVENIGISDVLGVCQTLETLVKKSFGPNALSTLISSASGSVSITSDGVALIQCIKSESPISKIILDSVISHHSLVGDNSKSYILLLTELVRGIFRKCTTGKSSDIFKLRDGFVRLNSIMQTTVLEQLKEKTQFNKTVGKDMKELCANLVQTSISGKFDMVTCRVLADIVVHLVSDCDQTLKTLNQYVCEIIDDFADLFLKISGQSVSMSRIIPGIVIQKDFCLYFEENLEKMVKFILLNESLQMNSPQTSTTIYLQEQKQSKKAFTYPTTSLKQKLKVIVDKGINLILTTDNFTDSAKHFCGQYKVSVVDLLSLEDLDRISKFTGTLINSGLNDQINDSCVGVLKCCERIAIGNKVFVNVVPDSGKVRQVIICAPSSGLVNEYTRSVGNAIKIVRIWTQEVWDNDKGLGDSHDVYVKKSLSGTYLATLPGGGATEIIVSNALTDYAQKHRHDHFLLTAALLMAEAVLIIPQTLYQNSFSPKSSRSWMSVFNTLIHNVKRKDEMISVNGKNGRLVSGFEVGIVVSLASKMKLYNDVLQLLQHILKIDTVIF